VVLHWGLISGQNDREGDLAGIVRLLSGTGQEAGSDRLDLFLNTIGPVLGLPGSRVVPRVGRDVKASCGMFVSA
jgi:hypothetical protein